MEQADTPSAVATAQKAASMAPSETAHDSPPPQGSEGQSKSTGGAKGAKRYNPRHGQGKQGKKKREVGRAEWSRNAVDKRARHEENQRSAKRRRVEGEDGTLPIYSTKFSAEEIASEARKPKRKAAVLIGYSGSGYKGMQLNNQEKTIEGDLFRAFVAAGAISKANADDPKKSSLVRCARTDKGVHAAGNLISLKLVIEDPDIVSKINEALSPQIRIWGIERTNNSFSSYQLCDSRIYEYLIPSYCLLPPHPRSFLGQEIERLAKDEKDLDCYLERQADVADFWKDAEEHHVQPVLESLDPSIRDESLSTMYNPPSSSSVPSKSSNKEHADSSDLSTGKPDPQKTDPKSDETGNAETSEPVQADIPTIQDLVQEIDEAPPPALIPKPATNPTEAAIRAIKSAQNTAKRAYRISPTRLARLRSTLSRFMGTHKFHNYTIDKTARDASANRVIKSFTVDDTPIMIGGTEWLSLKVHGQSFMMHQIRKMVSAAALIVRCGCHEGRIQDTYLDDRLSIPKAPSLGLLLERPVFDAYNEKLVEFGRERIDFGKYEVEIREFKQREIYERIYREEENEGVFLAFFASLDFARSASLLWVSSAGIEGTKRADTKVDARGRGEEEKEIEEIEGEDEHGAQEDN